MKRLLSALVILSLPAHAADVLPGPIPAEVVSVYDGDTMTVRAAIWPGHYVETAVRLRGVDTPERRGRCAAETAAAEEARAALARLADRQVRLIEVAHDKYGRALARVLAADGTDIAAALIAAGLGRPYDGGRRAGWCD